MEKSCFSAWIFEASHRHTLLRKDCGVPETILGHSVRSLLSKVGLSLLFDREALFYLLKLPAVFRANLSKGNVSEPMGAYGSFIK